MASSIKPINTSNESGMTEREEKVAACLVEAWNEFLKIETAISVDDQKQFMQAIHSAQSVLMMRVTKRLFPKYWNK